jgi:LacI family transcriptional regulator
MKVTARDIAERLNISAAAVSLALNGKAGVSETLRQKVITTAMEMGYDFSRLEKRRNHSNTICFVFYHKNFVFDTPFFTELAVSVEKAIKAAGFDLVAHHIHEQEKSEDQVTYLNTCHFAGIILLGTAMPESEFAPFMKLNVPLVLLDSCFSRYPVCCVKTNNVDGAFLAADYLIRTRRQQPGHLQANQEIVNFAERTTGFRMALQANHMEVSQSIVHELTPSADGAYADMLEILRRHEPTASCYFADNDEIAIGAMRAFKEMHYRIPEDVAIIGFDNLNYSQYVDPPLTTMDVPKKYMGDNAVQLLINRISKPDDPPVKMEISPSLVIRSSA